MGKTIKSGLELRGISQRGQKNTRCIFFDTETQQYVSGVIPNETIETWKLYAPDEVARIDRTHNQEWLAEKYPSKETKNAAALEAESKLTGYVARVRNYGYHGHYENYKYYYWFHFANIRHAYFYSKKVADNQLYLSNPKSLEEVTAEVEQNGWASCTGYEGIEDSNWVIMTAAYAKVYMDDDDLRRMKVVSNKGENMKTGAWSKRPIKSGVEEWSLHVPDNSWVKKVLDSDTEGDISSDAVDAIFEFPEEYGLTDDELNSRESEIREHPENFLKDTIPFNSWNDDEGISAIAALAEKLGDSANSVMFEFGDGQQRPITLFIEAEKALSSFESWYEPILDELEDKGIYPTDDWFGQMDDFLETGKIPSFEADWAEDGYKAVNSSAGGNKTKHLIKSAATPVEEAILKAVQSRIEDLYPGKGLKAVKVIEVGNDEDLSDEEIIEDPEMAVAPTILFDLNGQQDEVYLGNDAGEWEWLYTLPDNYPELKSSRGTNMKTERIKNSSAAWNARVQEIMDEEGVTREEAEALLGESMCDSGAKRRLRSDAGEPEVPYWGTIGSEGVIFLTRDEYIEEFGEEPDEKDAMYLHNSKGGFTKRYVNSSFFKPVRFAPLTSAQKRAMMKADKLASARGQVLDSWRGLVRDILAQVPSLSKVPANEQGIKKDGGFEADHASYYYRETVPTGGDVEIEFHVDPTDGWTEVYVQSARDYKILDHFTIEDLEDYSPAEVDRIDTAVASFPAYWAEVQERQRASGRPNTDLMTDAELEKYNASLTASVKRQIKSGFGQYDVMFSEIDDKDDFDEAKPYHAFYHDYEANMSMLKSFDSEEEANAWKEELDPDEYDSFEVYTSEQLPSTRSDDDFDNFDGFDDQDGML